jgi:hypothetical protein
MLNMIYLIEFTFNMTHFFMLHWNYVHDYGLMSTLDHFIPTLNDVLCMDMNCIDPLSFGGI